MKVFKLIEISAAHLLDSVEKCRRLHGHNYRVEVELEGTEGKDGMLVDFNEIKAVVMSYDHKFLAGRSQVISLDEESFMLKLDDKYKVVFPNEWVKQLPETSTAENISKAIAQDLEKAIYSKMTVKRIKVKVYETSSSYAEHERVVKYD
ncbi:MAG: 6-carboxytetrahydropterin synthase [Candidatus Parvarchaeum sp.]